MGRGKLWAIIRREYLERVRTKWFLIGTFFGPLLFGGLLFLPAYLSGRGLSGADAARVRVIDATGTTLGQRIASVLAGGLTGDTALTRVIAVDAAELPEAERAAERELEAGVIKGYLVVDQSTAAGVRAEYVGSNATLLSEMESLRNAVRRSVLAHRMEAAGLAPDVAESLAGMRVEVRTERYTPGGRAGSARLNLLFAIAVAALLYVTIFLYGQAVLRGVIEEKQNRVAEVVVSSITPTKLLTGKVLGVGAVGLTQLAIWIAAGFLMLRLREPVLEALGRTTTPLILPRITPGMLLLLVCFFVLGYLFYASIFAAVGAMVSTEQEAQQAQLPVAMLLIGTIAFLGTTLQAPDSTLAVNLSLLPFSSPILMPLRLSVVDVPAWQVVVAVLELVLACVVAVWVAARIYRTGLLMYGKRASLREVVRWVRAP